MELVVVQQTVQLKRNLIHGVVVGDYLLVPVSEQLLLVIAERMSADLTDYAGDAVVGFEASRLSVLVVECRVEDISLAF